MWSALMLALLCAAGAARAQDLLFDYGTGVGDASLHRNDDGYSSQISLSTPFVFFASQHSALYVCTNGIISFGAGISSYTPTPFPIASRPVVAPFWGDVDIRSAGAVYYREVTSGDLLNQLTDVIVTHFGPRNQVNSDFQATWAFVVTWDDVPAYPGSGSERNKFQAVLITDGTNSFVIYNYDSITWTFGSASNGVSAQVGFDAGDQTNFFALPSSRTSDIVNVDDQTNVGLVGRWMFRVDQAEIIDGGEEPTCNEEGCDPHQRENEDGNCENIAPALNSCAVTLDGPFITNELTNQFEFECAFTIVVEEGTDLSNYWFEVEWLFNRRPSTLNGPILTTVQGTDSLYVRDNQVTVYLSELQLSGAHHLGKWLSCGVTSYYADSPNERSEQIISAGYWIGVKPMVCMGPLDCEPLDYIELDEADDEPQHVYLISTLPIQGFFGSFHHFFPIYAPSTMLVTQDRGFNCSYDFYGEDWNPEESWVHHYDFPLKVRTITTAVTEPLMIEFIDFRAPEVPGFDYWEGYAPASIAVYRYNEEDRRPEYCVASGDPRMSTFDNLPYNFNARGQFVLVESMSSRGFEVHIRTFGCSRPTTASCVCGLVVREGDTLWETNRCVRYSYYGYAFPENDVRNTNGSEGLRWVVHRESTGNHFSVTTPAGAQIRLDWNRNWGYNVYVNLIGADFGRIEGLCGTFDRDSTDDLAYRPDRWDGVDRSADPEYADVRSRDELNDFVQAWRIPRLRSLFEIYPPSIEEADDVTDDRTSYCACVEAGPDSNRCNAPENQPLPDLGLDILDVAIAGNSNGPSGNNIGSASPFLGFGNLGGGLGDVGALGRRRRRSVAQDTFDFAENSTNINENTFPTASGITEQQAIDYCTQELAGNSSCSGFVHSNVTAAIINNCVQDVRDMDSMDDVSSAFIGETSFVCLASVVRSVNVTGQNLTMDEITAQVNEIIGPIVSSLCPADCNHRGTCSNSTCTCDEGWVGGDCSIDDSLLPDVYGFLGGDTCDSSNYECSWVTVSTDNIYDNDGLACKVVYGEQEYIMAALVANNLQLHCDLPDLLIGTNNQLDLSISATRNGVDYGSAATYRIYDGNCLTCTDAETDCTIQGNMCSVGGQCYTALERNTEALCYQCVPETNQESFTFEEGCVSSEVGVGEWGVWDDYVGCSANCDYGWNYRYRSCLVADTCLTGSNEDRMLCLNYRCDQVDDEIENGCLLTFDGATEAVIGQIVDQEESIASLIAASLNTFSWDNAEDVCDLVGVEPGDSLTMDMFGVGHITIAAGTVLPDTTSDSTSLRVVAEISSESVRSACGQGVTRRDADTVYVERWMLEEALQDTFDNFENLGLDLIRIGEEADESSSEEKEKGSKEHKSNAAVVGVAIGCALAAIAVIGVIAGIVIYKSKKNRPVTPMNPNVQRHEEVPMGCKTKVINVAGFSAAPPAYDDADGLAWGARQVPPTLETRGHKMW